MMNTTKVRKYKEQEEKSPGRWPTACQSLSISASSPSSHVVLDFLLNLINQVDDLSKHFQGPNRPQNYSPPPSMSPLPLLGLQIRLWDGVGRYFWCSLFVIDVFNAILL